MGGVVINAKERSRSTLKKLPKSRSTHKSRPTLGRCSTRFPTTIGVARRLVVTTCTLSAAKLTIGIMGTRASRPLATERGFLPGYVDGVHEYRVWYVKNRIIRVTRDATFTNDPLSTPSDAITIDFEP